MRAPVLEGAAARLRPLTEEDVPFLVRFANDEDLRGWLRFWRPMTEADELGWVRNLDGSDDVVWAMVKDGVPVGCIGLHQVDRVAGTAELGLGVLDASKRGRGIGHEACGLVIEHAFGGMGLQRVWLHVYTDNPAVRLYERLGFRREGTLRRHGFKRGAWRDQHVYGLLREEWSA